MARIPAVPLVQCLQPYRNPTRNPGFFKKPNLNLTRNFKTQTQPKTEFENLTQPKKTGFILGCFAKKIFQIYYPNFQENFTKKKFFRIIFFILNFIQTFFATQGCMVKPWSTIEDIHDFRSQWSTMVSHTAQNHLATVCRSQDQPKIRPTQDQLAISRLDPSQDQHSVAERFCDVGVDHQRFRLVFGGTKFFPPLQPNALQYPNRIELVFHTKNNMKYQSLHTILKYRFNIPFRYEIPIFCA